MTKARYNWLQTRKLFKAVFVGIVIMIIILIKFAGKGGDNSDTLAVLTVFVSFLGGFISYKITEHKYRKDTEYIDYVNIKNKDITPIKIEFLGNNQAFQTGLLATYNWTQYTVKITYASNRVEIKKVNVNYLKKHADIVEK